MNRAIHFVSVGAACLASGCASTPPASQPLPVAQAPQAPTSAAVTPADLRLRLSIYADDSMLGREAGTLGNVRATDYIAQEVERLGLEPGGTNGTYFQTVPMVERVASTASAVTVGGEPLSFGTDFVPLPHFEGFIPVGMRGSLDGVSAIYGGRLDDAAVSLAPAQMAGKLVVLDAPLGPGGTAMFQFWAAGDLNAYAAATGVAIVTLDISPPGFVNFLQQPHGALGSELPEGPLGMIVTRAAAERLLGVSLEQATVGTVGQTLRGSFRFSTQPTPYPARNVIAILPGGDPAVRGEYVALGAHNDHVGIANQPVDHDSLRAFNRVVRPQGADSPPRPATAEEAGQIRDILDSLRGRHPIRQDSIYNGADDDGSGTVTLIEIAEALVRSPERPRRSMLFVWHTAEEEGLFGSEYFTEHPTVPRDSIVAQLNLDMVGRGGAGDLEGGGPGYLQLIGTRRLSTELGDLVERVNVQGGYGFQFDYQYDADGHPANYYCRSDHYMYARYGIPIAFFSTGGHEDYHQVTDELQYIDSDKLARVARLVMDIARTVANLDHRVAVDKPKPDPDAPCQQ